MKAPKPPPTPDPYKVASAQTSSNVSTAVATTVLANADEDTPDGSIRYAQYGTYELADPQYDSNGNKTGETVRLIPKFKRTITLSPDNQILYNQQQQTSQEMNAWALTQMQRLNSIMVNPFDLSGATPRASTPAPATIDTTSPSRGTLVRQIGSYDYAAERLVAENAILDRINYNIARDRAARVVKLECMGIFPGSKAYEREMLAFDRQSNDARIQAYLAAAQEHTRLFEIEAKKAEFNNQAQAQDLQQQMLIIEFANKNNLMKFQMLLQLASFVDTQRAASIQEQLLVRTVPIQELAGLLHGTKVEQPQFQNYRAGAVSDTPVGQFVYQSAAMDMQKWQTRVQMQQQMMGGMLSLGGSLLSMGMMGGGGGMGGGLFGLLR